MLHHLKNDLVFNFVEGLLKIQYEDNNLFLRVMAQMKELECPSKTILDGPAFNETILVSMYKPRDDTLQAN